jgi:hypothetical protein
VSRLCAASGVISPESSCHAVAPEYNGKDFAEAAAMGAFYGSIHVRTEDHAGVLAAARTLAKKRKLRLLVAPVLRGWVTVFPENNGQDETVSAALARALTDDVLHFLVHDDDIFCYSLYRNGKLIDRYNSNPDYFEEVSSREKAKSRGRPEVFAELLPDASRLDELKALLTPAHAEQTVFAGETMLRFAELLELPNAASAYEYLTQGETDDIEAWDDFTHVPDQTEEKAKQRAVKAEHETARQRLRDQGILLCEDSRPQPPLHHAMPHWCTDGAGGFLVCWASGMARAPCPLEHYRPPWTKPEPTGIELPPTAWTLSRSPSGRHLGVGHASGNWLAQVWDLAGKSLVLNVNHAHVVNWVGFTPDETQLISLGSADSFVTSLQTRERLATIAVPHAKLGALHPSGTLIVADELGKIALVDLPSGAAQKTLAIGDKDQLEARRQHEIAQMRQTYAAFDEDAFEKALQLQLDQIDNMVKKMAEHARKSEAGGADVAQDSRRIKEHLLQSIERQREQFAQQRRQAQAGDVPLRSSEKVFAMALDRAGRWLFLGTDRGVRVFAWNDVHAAQDVMPAPALRSDAPAVSVSAGMGTLATGAIVYSVAYDEPAGRLLFGGLSGRIDALELRSGQVSTVLDLPGKPTVLRVGLSDDAAVLACWLQPDLFAQGKNRQPPVLSIWNYAALSG